MAINVVPGQTLGRGDLSINLTDAQDNPQNAAVITYALYYIDNSGPVPVEVLIGDPNRVPVNPQIGEYYAAVQIPGNAVSGEYRIKWTFKQYVSSSQQQVAQTFNVVGQDSQLLVTSYTEQEWQMIHKLRMHLRDQNPSKFYHFRPPEFEGDLGQYNQVFGQIWEDAELYENLEASLDQWNTLPPFTGNMTPSLTRLVLDHPAWRSPILWGAIGWSCFQLMANWTADEFSLGYQDVTKVILPGGRVLEIPIGELWEMAHGQKCNDPIHGLLLSGRLGVEAVVPATGEVRQVVLDDVLRHYTPRKQLVKVTLEDGRSVTCTEDHSIFCVLGLGIIPFKAGNLKPGDKIVTVKDGKVQEVAIGGIDTLPPMTYTFDLSVPGPENFVLANGILAHNSYSIGGVSLDLEKSSKYQTLKDSADQQFDKSAEAKVRTVKFVRGLSQPRFGRSTRASFGPYTARGVLGPRAFTVFAALSLVPIAFFLTQAVELLT